MKSRLKKIALMPTEMFKSQLDQISDKGRDVLKVLEEYKFFVEQTSRVMKNDPALTEVIMSKKKNLEESAQKIYDIVFDIENLDISALYDRQQEVTNNEEPDTSPQPEESEDLKLPDSEESPKAPEPSKTPEEPKAPATPEEPKEDKVEKEEEPKEEKSDKKDKPKSRLKNKSEDDEDEEEPKEDSKEKEDKK